MEVFDDISDILFGIEGFCRHHDRKARQIHVRPATSSAWQTNRGQDEINRRLSNFVPQPVSQSVSHYSQGGPLLFHANELIGFQTSAMHHVSCVYAMQRCAIFCLCDASGLFLEYYLSPFVPRVCAKATTHLVNGTACASWVVSTGTHPDATASKIRRLDSESPLGTKQNLQIYIVISTHGGDSDMLRILQHKGATVVDKFPPWRSFSSSSTPPCTGIRYILPHDEK